MKKLLTVLCIIALLFAVTACSTKPAAEETPIVNPVNLSFSLLDGEDELDLEDFEEIQDDPFIAEEGSSVLEATQLYCMSHDISISVAADIRRGDQLCSEQAFLKATTLSSFSFLYCSSEQLPTISIGF